ncbi:DoxX family protein [uncultured Maribacter sp.]|uniref:DoxX family protein n=1 Tax=uncultured Maribacter sp. TaxID=431308 RepID=UPI00260FDA07|nr:DoxX family protein [uncultured Maribacter sp.]
MKNARLYYTIAITLFATAIIAIVANSYINYDSIVLKFEHLGYPPYLIHVLGVAQILGLVIVVSNRGKWLLEWAYAGFFMNFTFGIIAHLLSKDGNGATAVICLILVWVTYIQNKKLKYHKETSKQDIELHHLKKVA